VNLKASIGLSRSEFMRMMLRLDWDDLSFQSVLNDIKIASYFQIRLAYDCVRWLKCRLKLIHKRFSAHKRVDTGLHAEVKRNCNSGFESFALMNCRVPLRSFPLSLARISILLDSQLSVTFCYGRTTRAKRASVARKDAVKEERRNRQWNGEEQAGRCKVKVGDERETFPFRDRKSYKTIKRR